jgi:hypothetical protein
LPVDVVVDKVIAIGVDTIVQATEPLNNMFALPRQNIDVSHDLMIIGSSVPIFDATTCYFGYHAPKSSRVGSGYQIFSRFSPNFLASCDLTPVGQISQNFKNDV